MKSLSEDQKKLVDATYCRNIVATARATVSELVTSCEDNVKNIESTRRAVRDGLEKMAATFNAARDELYDALLPEDKTLPGREGFPTIELRAGVEGPIGEVPSLLIQGVWGCLHLRVTPLRNGTYRVKRGDTVETLDIDGVNEAFGKVIAEQHPVACRARGAVAEAAKKFPVALG